MWELDNQPGNINDSVFSGRNVLEPEKNGDCEDRGKEMIPIEKTPLCNGNKDAEVDIIGCSNFGKALVVKDTCGDETESSSSSSFGDTGSDTDNAVAPFFGDPEVQSQMRADGASSSMCDDWHESHRRRKKRVTDHWRNFVSPITWRCKWIELKLIQLQSQARKYDKELAAFDNTKQRDFAHLTLDGSDIKSVPISGRMHKHKVMRRRKREKVEENCDLASYMSNHSLFSYYEKADHNVVVDSKDCRDVAIGGESENEVEFKFNDLQCSVNYDANDKSWEELIQKIEATQSKLQNLKSRYDKVISENPGIVCSINQSSMPGPSDGLNHSDLIPASFAGDEEIAPLIEASDRPELDVPCNDIKDEDLTQHQVAKEELHELENVGYQLVKKIESIQENKVIYKVQVSEPGSSENAVHNVNEQSTLRSCSTLKSNIPRNKRNERNENKRYGGSKRSRFSG